MVANLAEQHDVIVVGSSPICVMAAIKASRSGASVLLLERNERLGGAWRLTSVFGIDDVEIGPHVMRRNRRAYREIQRVIGVTMVPMQPMPREIFQLDGRPRTIAYEQDWLKNLPRIVRDVKRVSLCRASLAEHVGKPIRRSANAYWKYLRNGSIPQHYPESGCRELLAAMQVSLAQHRVEVRTKCQAKVISLDTSVGRIALTTDSLDYSCSRVLVNPHLEGVEMRVDGARIAYDMEPDSTYQAHFLVRSGQGGSRTFNFLGEASGIRMVSDVTRFAQGLPDAYKDCQIYAAWINERYADPRDPEELMTILKHNGILHGSADLVDYEVSLFERRKLAGTAKERITQSMAPFVEILDTDDLTEDCLKVA